MNFSVSVELYEEVKQRLIETIGERDYFSGHIEFCFAGWDCRLVCTCFVRRRELMMPEGRTRPISDLVPVWWEFHTADCDAERLNDFSFSELRARF